MKSNIFIASFFTSRKSMVSISTIGLMIILFVTLYTRSRNVLPDVHAVQTLETGTWIADVKKSFLAEIDKISDDEVASANEEAIFYGLVPIGVAEVKGHLRKFVTEDLESHLATTLDNLTPRLRSKVLARMLSTKVLPLKVVWIDSAYASVPSEGSTNQFMSINAPLMGAEYDTWRQVLGHEVVHLFIQGIGNTDFKYLMESLTEFLNARTLQALGKPYSLKAYKDEAMTAAALVTFMEKELLTWYVSDDVYSDKDLASLMTRELSCKGVAKDKAEAITGAWVNKLTEPLESISLTLKGTTLGLAVQSLKAKESDVEIRTSELNYVFRNIEELALFCGKHEVLPLEAKHRQIFTSNTSFFSKGDKDGLNELFEATRLYGKELLPVIECLLFGDPLPKELSPIQKRLAATCPSGAVRTKDDIRKLLHAVIEEFKPIEKKLDAERKENYAERLSIKKQIEDTKTKLDRLKDRHLMSAEMFQHLTDSLHGAGYKPINHAERIPPVIKDKFPK